MSDKRKAFLGLRTPVPVAPMKAEEPPKEAPKKARKPRRKAEVKPEGEKTDE